MLPLPRSPPLPFSSDGVQGGSRDAGEGGNLAHDAGPEVGCGGEQRSGGGVEEGARQGGGAAYLPAKLPMQRGLEEGRGLAGEDGPGRTRAGVERDAHAIAGEGRDHGGLVAHGLERGREGLFANEAVGDGAEGERFFQQRLSVVQALSRVEVGALEFGQEARPAAEF